MNWIQALVQRWRARNLMLACPSCREALPSEAFRRARYMLGDEKLTCERCGEANSVTLWRFEGFSRLKCQANGADLSLVNREASST